MIVVAKFFCSECYFRQVPFHGNYQDALKRGAELCYNKNSIDDYDFTVVKLTPTKDNKEQEGDE